VDTKSCSDCRYDGSALCSTCRGYDKWVSAESPLGEAKTPCDLCAYNNNKLPSNPCQHCPVIHAPAEKAEVEKKWDAIEPDKFQRPMPGPTQQELKLYRRLYKKCSRCYGRGMIGIVGPDGESEKDICPQCDGARYVKTFVGAKNETE